MRPRNTFLTFRSIIVFTIIDSILFLHLCTYLRCFTHSFSETNSVSDDFPEKLKMKLSSSARAFSPAKSTNRRRDARTKPRIKFQGRRKRTLSVHSFLLYISKVKTTDSDTYFLVSRAPRPSSRAQYLLKGTGPRIFRSSATKGFSIFYYLVRYSLFQNTSRITKLYHCFWDVTIWRLTPFWKWLSFRCCAYLPQAYFPRSSKTPHTGWTPTDKIHQQLSRFLYFSLEFLLPLINFW